MDEIQGQDFDTAFDGETTETPSPTESQVEEQTREQAPEYVQVTKTEWEDLKGKAAKVDEIVATTQTLKDTAFGRLGRLEARIGEMQTAGVTDEDLAELANDYPDLANLGVFKKLKGTVAAAPGGADPETLEKLVQQRVDPVIQSVDERIERAVETRLLANQYEDWREIVGLTPEGKVIQTPYRDWLTKQPTDYQQQVGGSWNHKIVGASIKKFKEEQAKAQAQAQQQTTRQARLAAAVPARGDVAVPSKDGSQDDFEAGFNE